MLVYSPTNLSSYFVVICIIFDHDAVVLPSLCPTCTVYVALKRFPTASTKELVRIIEAAPSLVRMSGVNGSLDIKVNDGHLSNSTAYMRIMLDHTFCQLNH